MTRMFVKTDSETRLFTYRSVDGSFCCYGWDLLEKALRRYEAHLGMHHPKCDHPVGTYEMFQAYNAAVEALRKEYARTGRPIAVDYHPQLKFSIGKTVEVMHQGTREKEKFTVGRSCGWMPVLLKLTVGRSTPHGDPICPDKMFLSVREVR